MDVTRLILTSMHAYTNVYVNQAASFASNAHNPRCITCLCLILFVAKLYNHPSFCFGLDITHMMGVVESWKKMLWNGKQCKRPMLEPRSEWNDDS